MNFVPLKITAQLECGVVADRFLPIDSIIDRQCNREALGHEDVSLPGEVLEPRLETIREQMPIQRIRSNALRKLRLHYYAASFAEWSDDVESSDHWVKKFDSRLIELLDRKKLETMGRLNVGAGRYRGYYMPVFYRAAREVVWYVVGDGDRIRALLSTLTHIGKKTSQGWGSVSRWIVEPHAEDWSCWRDGKPMRAIPAATGILYGVRPSYWLPQNQTTCILPEIEK